MKRAALLAAVVIVAQALLIPLFVGPAANMAPRDLPIAVAGPGPATSAITAKLQAEEGAFTITQAADATAADQLIRDREVYGAFVVTASGVEVHTAPAASPVVATLLSAAAAENNAKVVAVVPLPADDPRGAGFTAGFLPLLLTGMLAGILLVVLVPLKWARLLGSLGYAVGSGLIGSVVLREWLGVITGNYWADAAAVGLVGLAASALVAGLGSVFGPPGIGLGALTVFLVGNPLSGVAGAPELLPQPWGDVGQHLPAGAGATLLRSVAFFDGAGSAYSMWVLIAYVVGGLALIAVSRSTRPAVQPVAEPVREPVTA